MQPYSQRIINRRVRENNVWLERPGSGRISADLNLPFKFNVLQTEDEVGEAMFGELSSYAEKTDRDLVVVLLGGRGAQAMYRLINKRSATGELDDLLARLHVFTQDALAPMRMNNGLSFVRDFERLLGQEFFSRVKSFTPMLTETDDIEGALLKYLEKLEALGGIDLFFLGHGPEANSASHLCYIKPRSGAAADDVAGIIPISSTILEHHISKFKAGGSDISTEDEDECRRATSILTLGPAAILGAKKIVQSIVDASTAPAKRESFKRFLDTRLSDNKEELAEQLDENPGLWIRLNGNVASYILPDLI